MNNYVIKNDDEVNYFLDDNVYRFSFNDFLYDATNDHSNFPLLERGYKKFENFFKFKNPNTVFIKVLNVGRLLEDLNEFQKRRDVNQMIIEFFDCLVHVYDITKFCPRCFIKRYQEGMDSSYTKYIKTENDYEVNFVSGPIEEIKNENKNFVAWDKNLNQYYDSPCLCYPDCTNEYTSNISLKK